MKTPNLGVHETGSRPICSYLYGVADDAIAVHIYGASTARLEVGGRPVTLV